MLKHRVIFGNCMSMQEIMDESIHLIVTSPPYFNAPFDYVDSFKDYDDYLNMLHKFACESYRVLQEGRIVALNIDDMLVNGIKYPITSDATQIFLKAGFRYRDKITWKKPDGYLRIARRGKVLIQNPFPMYFYPDNLIESIIIFQKGTFNYRSVSQDIRNASMVDIKEYKNNKWNVGFWEITNVLPNAKLEKGIAAFPDELPYRLIKLYSYKYETVLDPFLGSGTTMKVSAELDRHFVGFELSKSLEPIILQKIAKVSKIKKIDIQIRYREDERYGYIS